MIQIVFTPAVQWTFLVGLCYTPRVSKSPADLEINGHPLVSLNGAFVLIALYCTYYIYLDRLFGMAYSVVAAPPLYLFAQVFFASVGRTLAWRYALAIHLLSWAIQLVSHCLLERRKPALLSALQASMLVGPLFSFTEILFLGGYRRSLYNRVHARAKREIDIARGRLSPPSSPSKPRRR